MEQLTQRDLESSLSFLRGIYAELDLDSLATRIVKTLPEIIPSDVTSCNEVNLRSRKVTATREPEKPVPQISELMHVLPRHMHEHPLLAGHRRTNDGRASRISDYLTTSQFHRLGLYDEFYREMGLEREVAIILPSPPSSMTMIMLDRGGGRDFSERDRLVLDALRPHLIQAYHNAESVTRLRQDSTLARQTMERLDRGVISLTEKNEVQLCTEQARQWLSEYFEQSRREENLPESLSRWVEHQRSLLSQNGDMPPPREPLILQREGKRLMVRLVDDRSKDQRLLLLEERLSPFSAASLQTLGLTPREAEILRWIARGKTNKEIATILYISSLTVRKHLEHVYQKLGVVSRTEATARMLDASGLPR